VQPNGCAKKNRFLGKFLMNRDLEEWGYRKLFYIRDLDLKIVINKALSASFWRFAIFPGLSVPECGSRERVARDPVADRAARMPVCEF
jgi:hypothetical protein